MYHIFLENICKNPQTIEWGYRYNALIERYSHIIKGQFFGHTHVDNFVIQHGFSLSEPTAENPIAVTFVHPSLTTHSGLNPSFRVYQADPDSLDLLDYAQYRMFIEVANCINMNACVGREYDSFGNYILFQIVIPYILPDWAFAL